MVSPKEFLEELEAVEDDSVSFDAEVAREAAEVSKRRLVEHMLRTGGRGSIQVRQNASGGATMTVTGIPVSPRLREQIESFGRKKMASMIEKKIGGGVDAEQG